MIRSVEEEQPKGIWVGDMKDGDVGVIIAWSTGATYSGRIIQRYKDSLFVVGMSSGEGWSIFKLDCYLSDTCRVRLLEKDEKLVVA